MRGPCTINYKCDQRIWIGPRGKEYYGSDMTIGEVAMRILIELNPNKVLQICDCTGERLTGWQLAQQGLIIAQAFKRLGLHRGDVIGVSANNTTYLTGVIIAALLSGTPINPLHPDFNQETVKYMYDITTPKLIFCDVENYEIIKGVNEQLANPALIYLVNGSIEGVPNVRELLSAHDGTKEVSYVPCPKLHGDHTAFIICSSGTTGMPKGVTRSHRSLLANSKNPSTYTRDSIVFTFSALYWISGTLVLLASLVNGCTRIITHRPYTVDYMLQVISHHRVSFVILASHQIALLSKSDHNDAYIRDKLESIKIMIGAGSKICKAVAKRMYDLITNERFIVGYGLSEMGGITKNVGGPLGSEGKIMRNVELCVLDKLGTPLGLSEVGIIHARLRYKWAGYYRNPEATKRAITADGQWLKTGDIGYLDSEGNLYIQTRDTDVFKYNNFQIYPEQVEEFVLQLPGVSEACVFGIPNEVSSNLAACAVVRTNTIEGHQLRASDVIGQVARHLGNIYHIRGGVFFVDALPKTANDKLQRRKVLAMIKELGIDAAQ
ncbi:probable 4-coumarate--CoA ligase 3 [Scaptodrosophila lebanonensis]|uniref:Probable 4-coumarate--CoA ligase 3 n=1 Tax=Drosophila lebanonensis TaxID=7225 RepID=A0A6J2UJ33_DROLE|nr:probable 4-coumarate--CoA ligase 3 [Scaptodrosophila lebanonensis]